MRAANDRSFAVSSVGMSQARIHVQRKYALGEKQNERRSHGQRADMTLQVEPDAEVGHLRRVHGQFTANVIGVLLIFPINGIRYDLRGPKHIVNETLELGSRQTRDPFRR